MHSAQLQAVLPAERDLGGTQRIYPSDLAVAEANTDGGLLWDLECLLGEPKSDAFAGGAWDWGEFSDGLPKLWNRRDNGGSTRT